MVKTNIYLDYKICVKCGDPADVIESNKDYCCECWFKHFSGETIEEYEKKVKQLDQARKDKQKNNG